MSQRAFYLFAASALIAAASFSFAKQAEPESGQQSDSENKDVFKNLKFRNLGPAAAGGRVSSVVGVPGDPSIYYVGAASGGVWKSTNGGITWKPVFEHEKTSSIGAIALAPSNSNFVWVGTG